MNRRTFLQSSLAAGVTGAGFLPVFPYREESSRPLAHLRLNANQQARKVLYHGFEELGIEHISSHANFVMYRVRNDLEQHITRMKENGVRVGRPFPPLLSYNRVSLGLAEEMESFVKKLRLFRSRGWI